jgi:hypothetical protein
MKPKIFALSMAVHRGVCDGCGELFQIAGGPEIGGYKIPAHYHNDLSLAKKGGMCTGGDLPPRKLVLAKR